MIGKLLFVLCFSHISAKYQLSDKEYNLMPPIFLMDDFDRCMGNSDESLFCRVTYQLKPLHNESVPEVWNIMEKISKVPWYYRHDQLRHEICVKQSCPNAAFKRGKQLKLEINHCFDANYRNSSLRGTVTQLRCVNAENLHIPLRLSHILSAILGVSYLLLVLYASYYEGTARNLSEEEYNKRTSTGIGRFLSIFSLPKNYSRLIQKNTDPDAVRLKVINGLRFYTMSLVILAHIGLLQLSGPVINPKATEEMTRCQSSVLLMNGNVAVHTFFSISSFLVTYGFYQMMEQYPKVRPRILLLAIVNRYLRLAPTVAVALFFAINWYEYLGAGPFWELSFKPLMLQKCKDNWWTNILFINNIINGEQMCFNHTWYLAVDMQLFVVTVLILGLVWKYRKFEKLIFAACFVISIVMPAYVAYSWKYPMVLTQYPEDFYDFNSIHNRIFAGIYTATHSNFGGWMVGVIFGYFYYHYKDVQFFTRKSVVILWYFWWVGAMLLIPLLGGVAYSDDYEYNPIHSALYWSLSRPIWALAAVTLIFGASQGLGGVVKSMFEWDFLTILGRLTFGAYILHPLVIGFRVSLSRSPIYANNALFGFYALSDISVSYFAAFLSYLLVEMPVSSLQKYLLPMQIAKKAPAVAVNGQQGKKID